jgi:hypothetical protein
MSSDYWGPRHEALKTQPAPRVGDVTDMMFAWCCGRLSPDDGGASAVLRGDVGLAGARLTFRYHLVFLPFSIDS